MPKRARGWREAESHPNKRLLIELPFHPGDHAIVFLDRKFGIFWREDRSENGPSSWSWWRLPRRRVRDRVAALSEALWQAYYHKELDLLADRINNGEIDGNDHPELRRAAEAIIGRLP